MSWKIKYLIWEQAEVATSRGKVWRCFCGNKEDSENFMRLHLKLKHDMVKLKYEESE